MSLDTDAVTAKLIEIVTHIQRLGHYADAAQVTAATKPLIDLEGFDSKVAPVAIGMLGAALGINIPVNRNIFVDGRRRLTIAEAAKAVVELARPQVRTA